MKIFKELLEKSKHKNLVIDTWLKFNHDFKFN